MGGLRTGARAVLIGVFTPAVPGGVMLSILLRNALAPLVD